MESHQKGERMNYKIPADVLEKIPDYFWPAFAGELLSVFGLHIYQKNDGINYDLYHISGTMGWNVAFKMACNKVGIQWLYQYYDALQWWESDQFDGEIEDLLIVNVLDRKDFSMSPYYLWLIGDAKGA